MTEQSGMLVGNRFDVTQLPECKEQENGYTIIRNPDKEGEWIRSKKSFDISWE